MPSVFRARWGGVGGLALALALASAWPALARAQPGPTYDAALASRLGADEYGMRHYVLVVLKTGPNRMPAGPARDAMFKGHFDNIKRLAAEGKLVLAGPFDGTDGWRGLFVLAVDNLDEAKALASTDPVLASGEMVAEYHKYYGSAALLLVPQTHETLVRKRF